MCVVSYVCMCMYVCMYVCIGCVYVFFSVVCMCVCVSVCTVHACTCQYCSLSHLIPYLPNDTCTLLYSGVQLVN